VLFSPNKNQTLRELFADIKEEDPSVKSVSIYESDGARISASSRLEEVFRTPFKLVIDGKTYHVASSGSAQSSVSSDKDTKTAADVKAEEADAFYQSVIAAGTPGTPIPAHMIPATPEEIKAIEAELFPLMREKIELDRKAYRFSDLVLFGGLGAFAAQYAFLARLTWWDFNWDIMEPVTYFITSGTALLAMFYFVLAKQEYTFENVRDGVARKRMATTYWRSAKFDVEKYFDLEYELKARDPEALLRLESYITGHTVMPRQLAQIINQATKNPTPQAATQN